MSGAGVDLFKIVPYLQEIEHQEAAGELDSAEGFIVRSGVYYTTK